MKRNFWFIAALVCLLGIVVLLGSCGGDDKKAVPVLTWHKTFGGAEDEDAGTVKQTSDGGYVIVGVKADRIPGAPTAIYLIKTDREGNELWSKSFGTSDNFQEGNSVVEASDGGYVVSGAIYPSKDPPDVYLMKTDREGNKQWARRVGSMGWGVAYSLQLTADGGYVLTGVTGGKNTSRDVYLIKTDSEGNEEWSKTFGGPEREAAESVAQASDGGYVIAGWTNSYGASPGGFTDAYLIKTDSNGNEQWSKTFGNSGEEVANSVVQTSDGGYIAAGYADSDSRVDKNVYLIKTDANGNEQWIKTLGGGGLDGATSVRQTPDGGYVVAGATYSYGDSDGDVYLVKTDSEGNELWHKTFGGPSKDKACEVELTSDGGYIIAGSTESYGAGLLDFYLIKTDAEGNCEPMPSSTPQ